MFVSFFAVFLARISWFLKVYLWWHDSIVIYAGGIQAQMLGPLMGIRNEC